MQVAGVKTRNEDATAHLSGVCSCGRQPVHFSSYDGSSVHHNAACLLLPSFAMS